ncbi:MAG: tripartite tricarboxylate transporter substrate binding protein [Burkholderiales bacterium]|nr:tripartite tricarboxylate transporter substrate binding protein [Burkholderiales bacterium]
MNIDCFARCAPKYVSVVLLAIACCANSFAASKSDYPNRPLRFVIVSGTGATNMLARLIGAQITENLGQQVVVDPRPGGSGIVAADIVSRATPDGYTLLLTFHSHTINAAQNPKLPYDPIKSFTPITQLTSSGSLLTVNSSSPPKSLAEFITWTKNYKGNISAGTPGLGSGGYLAAEMYAEMTGVKALSINHTGSGPALLGTVARQYQYSFTSIMAAMPFVRSGQLRAIAVTTTKRSQALPEIPAMAEALPGYEVAGWWGIMGPAGMPAPIVDRIQAEILKALKSPRITKSIEDDGAEVVGSSPAQFALFLKNDIAKWPKYLKAAGM